MIGRKAELVEVKSIKFAEFNLLRSGLQPCFEITQTTDSFDRFKQKYKEYTETEIQNTFFVSFIDATICNVCARLLEMALSNICEVQQALIRTIMNINSVQKRRMLVKHEAFTEEKEHEHQNNISIHIRSAQSTSYRWHNE